MTYNKTIFSLLALAIVSSVAQAQEKTVSAPVLSPQASDFLFSSDTSAAYKPSLKPAPMIDFNTDYQEIPVRRPEDAGFYYRFKQPSEQPEDKPRKLDEPEAPITFMSVTEEVLKTAVEDGVIGYKFKKSMGGAYLEFNEMNIDVNKGNREFQGIDTKETMYGFSLTWKLGANKLD